MLHFLFLNYWLILFNSFFNSVAQFFNPIAELAIPIGIPSKKGKVEIEINPVTVEAKIKKCSI